ncbi:hypothetical protein pb186bvf_014184 [Paramecium bursaria]
MDIFGLSESQSQSGEEFDLLLPRPTGNKRKCHAKIQKLQIRHNCDNICQNFQEFVTQTLKIRPKRETGFNNYVQRIAESYYRPINYSIKKKRLIHLNMMVTKSKKKGYEIDQKHLILSSLIIKIVNSLASQGYIIELIAEIVKQSVSTVRYIIKNRELEQNRSCFSWKQEHSDWVQNMLSSPSIKNCFSLLQLLKKFNEKFDCKLKRWKFQKLVQANLKISYRFPQIIKGASQTDRVKYLRYEFSIKIANYIQSGYEVVYLDETYIGRNLKKIKVWQLIHNPIKIKEFQPQFPLSILGGISTEGLLAYQLVQGSVNGIIYAQHLQQLNKQFSNTKKVLFILDNASIHKSESNSKIVLCQIDHLFLPPYTPQFNPIETFWALIKKSLFKSISYQANSDIQFEIHKIINSFYSYKIKMLCQPSTQYYLRGYLMEKF